MFLLHCVLPEMKLCCVNIRLYESFVCKYVALDVL